MAIVTGAVVDFQGSPRADLHPQIVFIPKGPSVRGAAAFFSREIAVNPDPDGLFSVALIDTAEFPGDFYYLVRIDWLNGLNIPVGEDYLPGQLRVPAAGGTLPALLNLPPTAFQVWVDLHPPLSPIAGQRWLETDPDNPDSQDPENTEFLYEWQE